MILRSKSTSSIGVLLIVKESIKAGGVARDWRTSLRDDPLSHTIEIDSKRDERQLHGGCKVIPVILFDSEWSVVN